MTNLINLTLIQAMENTAAKITEEENQPLIRIVSFTDMSLDQKGGWLSSQILKTRLTVVHIANNESCDYHIKNKNTWDIIRTGTTPGAYYGIDETESKLYKITEVSTVNAQLSLKIFESLMADSLHNYIDGKKYPTKYTLNPFVNIKWQDITDESTINKYLPIIKNHIYE